MGESEVSMGKEQVKLYHIAVTRVSDGVSVASLAVDDHESQKNSCERIVADTVKDAKGHGRLKEGMSIGYDYSDTRVGVYWNAETNCLYMAIAGPSATTAWLKSLSADLHSTFLKAVGPAKIDNASSDSLKKEFKNATKTLITMYQEDPQFVSQAQKVQKTLGDVRDITLDNISAQLERSQNIDDVNAKSEDLLNFSTQFRKDTKEAKCKALRNCILMYVLGFVIVAIIIVVLLAVLGVFKEDDKK